MGSLKSDGRPAGTQKEGKWHNWQNGAIIECVCDINEAGAVIGPFSHSDITDSINKSKTKIFRGQDFVSINSNTPKCGPTLKVKAWEIQITIMFVVLVGQTKY